MILLCCGIGRQYVAAVDLLDENRSVLKKSDWPYYALGIPILKELETQEIFQQITISRGRQLVYYDNYEVQGQSEVFMENEKKI